MSFEPGRSLLHYRLIDKIGEGGMGVVWRAADTSLDREVAIKVLPEAFASDADRLVRFEREAKLLASLNHPNIAAIYGLHEAGGVRFIAMEYVPGESLEERLARGPIPLDEALPIARRVAEALETAHERGVVHRDLKPANVKIGPDGAVKVLDLGLAKALRPDVSTPGAASISPTVTSANTAAGTILGTAAYMAPEQAKGKVVDRRADVWAFGVLLYEMLTGRRPFRGETVSEALAAVLRDDPDLDALPRSIPPSLRRLIGRCLDRDVQTRLQAIGEARITLVDLIRRGGRDEPGTTVTPRASPRAPVIVLLVAVLAALGAGYWLRASAPPRAEGWSQARLQRLTWEPGLEFEPTLSPDGNYVAYTTSDAGNLDIVVQSIDGGVVHRVTSHPADDAQPAWSPDGSKLAFTSARDGPGRLSVVSNLGILSASAQGAGGDIFIVPAMGGLPVKLVADGSSPAWSPSGDEIAFQSHRGGAWQIWIVPVDGSASPRRLSKLADAERIDYQPAWSPDGRFIVHGARRDAIGLVVREVDGDGDYFFPGRGNVMSPAWSRDGKFIYYASDAAGAAGVMNLWRVPFSADDPGRVTEPERVTVSEGSDIEPCILDGRIAYSRVHFAPDIWELTLADRSLRQITSGPAAEDQPNLSRDGRLAMTSDRVGSRVSVWTADRDGREMGLLSSARESAEWPRWSPDGGRVAYRSSTAEAKSIAVRAPGDLTVHEVVRVPLSFDLAMPEWSPDGRSFAYLIDDGRGPRIVVRALDGGEPRTLVARAGTSSFPTWSPDGRRLAYNHHGELPRQVWIVDLDEPGDTVGRRLTRDDGTEFSHPQWSPTDPDRILVVIDHLELGVVSVATGEVERLTELDASTVLVDYPSWSPDGKKIYFSLARKTGDIFLLDRR